MTTIERPLTVESVDITDESRYEREGYPWREWDLLRREAPVYWYDHRPDMTPFWSITKHEDIQVVSRHPEVFVSSKRLRLYPTEMDRAMAEVRALAEAEVGPAYAAPLSFNDMDPPDQPRYRNLTSRFFTPKAMRAMEPHMEELARQHVGDFARMLVDSVSEQGGCDFVNDIAVKVPTAAIFSMLGIPEEDQEQLFRWKDYSSHEPTPEQVQERMTRRRRGSFWDGEAEVYLTGLINRRRAEGANGEDLISVLVRAEVDGEKLPDRAILAYVNLLIAGGLDTTRHATTGGVVALLQHPDQLQLLLDAPEDLLKPAIEEILRYVSPVIHFTRTAVADFELHGQRIRAGDDLALWYPSANRDEEVFEEPYRFDITRSPNDHLAFGGYGQHFCFGSNLARWELYAVFRELLRLLPEMEIAGDLKRTRGLHVGGYRSLPVRYRPTSQVGVAS